MDGASSAFQSQFLRNLVEVAKKAFDPALDAASRETGQAEYQHLINDTKTWILLSALNTVIKPGVLPEWLRNPLMETLTCLPLRPDGVRSTLEFVFSVHPSNQNAEPSGPQKSGAPITHEGVAVAAKLLSSVPASMTPQAWFDGLSEQLLYLMEGAEGPELAKTAAQVVGFGILGRKQYGAPGSPGWNAFVKPLLESLNPSLRAGSGEIDATDLKTDEVEDLTVDPVLIPSLQLERDLERIRTLIMSNTSPGLCKRVLKPVLLQLWTVSSKVEPSERIRDRFCEKARGLVETYMRLFGNSEELQPVIDNLLVRGSREGDKQLWTFTSNNDDMWISKPRSSPPDTDLTEVNVKADTFVQMLVKNCGKGEVSSIFLHLFKRWILTMERNNHIALAPEVTDSKAASPLQELVSVTILQKLMDQAPEYLVSQFRQLVELIIQVFQADEKTSLDEDTMSVILSLLNLVITAPSFQKSDLSAVEISSIEQGLEKLSRTANQELSSTARNLALLLKYRDEMETDEEKVAPPSSRQVEDQRAYDLAMSYITALGDNPPPVVSEGLDIISGLVVVSSPVLDITTITALMSNLLQDNEDYINLRVIKVFTQLASKHPKSTTREIVDHYLDAQEKLSTNVRLRFGEALVQVVEKLGDTFTGETSQTVGETLLSIAGRRGYRPKTMAKQAREKRLEDMKRKKQERLGEDSGEDDVDLDDRSESERHRDDILAQIVQGWDSKRGTEDVRMRASALSIFGSALEVNISGIGSRLVSMSIDLCVNILTLEPEMEKAILRRAAIIVVLNFVRALQDAKEAGKSLGFGLTEQSREDITRTLEYVAGTDNDGLVQQHARDVVESLGNWQLAGLLPTQTGTDVPQLTRLAGLAVNPVEEIPASSSATARPRIEEIE